MKYPVEMGSDAMIYKTGFIKIISDIRNLIGEDPQYGNRNLGNDINHDRKQRNQCS
jgi:hypothetical protein